MNELRKPVPAYFIITAWTKWNKMEKEMEGRIMMCGQIFYGICIVSDLFSFPLSPSLSSLFCFCINDFASFNCLIWLHLANIWITENGIHTWSLRQSTNWNCFCCCCRILERERGYYVFKKDPFCFTFVRFFFCVSLWSAKNPSEASIPSDLYVDSCI